MAYLHECPLVGWRTKQLSEYFSRLLHDKWTLGYTTTKTSRKLRAKYGGRYEKGWSLQYSRHHKHTLKQQYHTHTHTLPNKKHFFSLKDSPPVSPSLTIVGLLQEENAVPVLSHNHTVHDECLGSSEPTLHKLLPDVPHHLVNILPSFLFLSANSY